MTIDTATIVRRLLTTYSVAAVARESGLTEFAVYRIYRQNTTPQERLQAKGRKIRRAKLLHNPARGGTPWNKGRRFPGTAPAGCFRKGHGRRGLSHFHAVGTVVTKAYCGYRTPVRWIKVAEKGPWHRRWRRYAEVVWEQHNGRKVPARHHVYHRDGDLLNDSPDNLVCLTRADGVRLLMRQHPGMTAAAAEALHEWRAVRAATKGERESRRTGPAPASCVGPSAKAKPTAKEVAAARREEFLKSLEAA